MMRIGFVSLIILLISFSSCDSTHEQADAPAYHNPIVQGITDALEQHPENAGLFFQRSEALMEVHEPNLARKDLLEAIRIDSLNPLYVQALGIISLQQDQPEDAVAAFRKCLKLVPGDARVRLLLCKAYLLGHDIPSAQMEVTKVYQAAPDFPGVSFAQAQIEVARGDTATGIAILEKYLAGSPNDYAASEQIGAWLSQANDMRAITRFRQTFAMDTTNVTPLWNIGKFYEARGQIQKAKSAYYACALRDPDYTDAFLAIGKILYHQDSVVKALRQFNLAVKTRPNSGEAYFQKGLCFEKLHQKDSAERAFAQVLVFHPDDQLAKDGLKRVKLD
jgi:Flp pilus assembly protein TadD